MSKGWNLIERFSEDLDVVIDRRFPGFTGGAAPETAPSQKQRARRRDALRVACQQYVRRTLLPDLELALVASPLERDRWRVSRVAAHRAVFFRKSREAQVSLQPGTLAVIASEAHRAAWRRDYEAMRESMLFDEPPSLDDILDVVGEFERRFNAKVGPTSPRT